MARLVVQPGTPTAWEIQLKPGANSIGRGAANDFKLNDGSVSSAHCVIIVEHGATRLKDLGSTNGTFVNRAPVKEAVLQPGQTVHLGSIEMLFHGDGAAVPAAAPTAPPGLPPPRAVGAPSALRISGTPAAAAAPPPAGISVARPAELAAPPVAAEPVAAVGSGPCKYHPMIPGRLFCGHCGLFFCDACVTTRAQKKFCRHCGSECTRVQVQIQRPTSPKGFFTRFPTAFIYPFRGAGVMWLLLSAVVLSFAEGLAGAWWSILVVIAAYGYLFAFMQNIIHATANEEEEMPGLPGFDDVFGCAFRFGVTVLICFGLPIAFSVLKVFGMYDAPPEMIIATMVLGCLYFPMAFLAVAMKDTALAANPLVVIPAIVKVPIGYLVTTGVVIGIYLLRKIGGAAAGGAEGVGYHTRAMSTLFLTFGIRAVWALVSVYLLTVSMRTLGLLYVTNKQKFGWFDR